MDVRDRSDHRRYQPMQCRGIGFDAGVEGQVLAQRHHRHAVVAQHPGYQYLVARTGALAGDVDALRYHADAGGGDEYAIDSTMRLRSASGKPSSRMKPAERYSGRAPDIATSLIVPCTERQPISPPGKNSGDTTWLSVDIT